MSDFPLYLQMCKDPPSSDLSVAQKTKFTASVKKLNEGGDELGKELIYALIKSHQLSTQEEQPPPKDELDDLEEEALPYKGSLEGNTVYFDFNTFPVALKHILFRFIEKHMENIQEDKELADVRSM